MRSTSRFVPALLLMALVLIFIISAVQWWAYENAKKEILSLPCDPNVTPYRAEVTSFLPPEELLKKGIGHRYDYSGELEFVIAKKLGRKSPGYDDLLYAASLYLNASIESLRQNIAKGDPDHIRLSFEFFQRNYVVLKLAREYGRRNLTEVILKPSPPLGWVLMGKEGLRELASLMGLKVVFLATFLTFAIFAAFFLWLIIVAKMRIRPRVLKQIVAFALFVLISTAAGWGVVQVAKAVLGENDGWTSTHNHECLRVRYYELYEKLYDESLEYTYSHKERVSCEAFKYLEHELSQSEIEKLRKALSLNCSS